MRTCHMISDTPGHAGSKELMAFARSIGCKPEWAQHTGTPQEHFDLLGMSRINAARKAGAKEVHPKQLVTMIQQKRGA